MQEYNITDRVTNLNLDWMPNIPNDPTIPESTRERLYKDIESQVPRVKISADIVLDKLEFVAYKQHPSKNITTSLRAVYYNHTMLAYMFAPEFTSPRFRLNSHDAGLALTTLVQSGLVESDLIEELGFRGIQTEGYRLSKNGILTLIGWHEQHPDFDQRRISQHGTNGPDYSRGLPNMLGKRRVY